MPIIDELLVSLGFKVEPEGLEKFAKHAEHVKEMVGAVFGFEVAKRIGEFVERTVESAAKVNDLAESYDIAATKMAAMGAVATAHSSSLEAISSAYGSVSSMAGQAAMGIGRGAMMFEAYGLKAKDASGKAKDGMEVMGDIADKMSKLSTTERTAMAGRLGIDPLLAKQMAEMGRSQFMKEIAEAEKGGLLSNKDYEMADETSIAFAQLHGTVSKFMALIAVQLGPTVKEIVKEFTAWVKVNRDLIVQKTRETFEKIRDIAGKVIDVIRELAKHGTALKIVFGLIIAQKMGGYLVESVAKPLWKVALGIKEARAAGELWKIGLEGLRTLLIGGVAAAIFLVAEDLWTFSRGGASVTGWLLERFPYAVDVAKQSIALLSAALVAMTARSGPIGLIALGIGELILLIDKLDQANKGMSQNWADFWDGIFDTVADVVNGITPLLRLMGADVEDMQKGVFGKNLNSRKQIEGFSPKGQTFEGYQPGWDNLRPDWLQTKEQRNMLKWGRGPLMAGAAAAGSTTNISQSVGPTTINVNGAGDPAKVAAKVMREQERRAQLARSRTRDAQAAHR